jgi:glycosyltransferase involved in cell wall biosynthesis
MRILFLTDNFPPETNAPAIRTFEHARVWVELGHQVTVITGVPNFPTGHVHDGYRNRPRTTEVMEGIKVVRVWTYVAPNEGVFRRSLDYLSFGLSAIPAGLIEGRADVVVGTSPQLLTVLAAWVVSRLRRAPCVFELRDLWPESIIAVGASGDGAPTRILGWLSGFLYRHVEKIVAVTGSFASILEGRGVPGDKIAVVRNGVDLDRFSPGVSDEGVREELGIGRGVFLVTYVGTVGMAHGLAVVLDAAGAAGDEPIGFLLVGDGAEKRRLEREASLRGLRNLWFLGRQPRSRVPGILAESDAVLVHLRDDPLFASVIPSKIFEAMATGRPIILGATGESVELVEDAGCGIAVTPESPMEILGAARRLASDADLAGKLGENGRRAAEERFSRRVAAIRMLGVLDQVAGATRRASRPPSPDSRGAAPPARPSRDAPASRERSSVAARSSPGPTLPRQRRRLRSSCRA